MTDVSGLRAHLQSQHRDRRASAAAPDAARFAFYGRVSTEDLQDPTTSLAWQRGGAEALIRGRGEIVVDYFDVGHSRSLPWRRRPDAARLLAEARAPGRPWGDLVVGEGKRTFYGNQFFEVEPVLRDLGVRVWLPELGGAYDPSNATHDALVGFTGSMGKAERQTVQTRVRGSMEALARAGDRFLGGRPPYGYRLVDAGPHPNPKRARDGQRVRRLERDEEAASVVERVFAACAAGESLRGIAAMLNAERVPCPSAHDRARNRHRRGDGWQVSTVAAILDNPRYTGLGVWGTWAKEARLLDPADAASGYVTRFVRSGEPTYSEQPAQVALVSAETWRAAQERRSSRAAGGLRAMARGEKARPAGRVYPLRGLLRCAGCGRKMQAEARRWGTYYRCRSRDRTPGPDAGHADDVYVREEAVRGGLDAWLAGLFDANHVEDTLAALTASQAPSLADLARADRARRRLIEATRRLGNLLDALEEGFPRDTLRERIGAAEAEIAAARADLEVAEREVADVEDLRALLGGLADVAAEVFGAADPADLAEFYHAVGLAMEYDAGSRRVTASVTPHGGDVRVRGGT